MSKSNKDRSDIEQIDWQKVVKLCLVVVSLATLFEVYYIFDKLTPRDPEVPSVVVEFLDAFLSKDYTTHNGLYLFPKYFYDIRNEMPGTDATVAENYSLEQDLFEQVFYKYIENYDGYIVEAINGSYAKVTPIKADGSLDYPSIGVWYTVKGRYIKTWRIARLQPFDPQDAEYSEDWYVVY